MMNLYLARMSQFFSDSSLFLVPDQAGWHKAKELRLPKNIRFDFLSAYSPDLNPVEKPWLHLRRHVCRNLPFESEQELEQALDSALSSLSHDSLNPDSSIGGRIRGNVHNYLTA
jgi:transposase